MRVRDIVKEWLEKSEYDGLYNDSFACGCFANDLMPCNELASEHCIAGYKTYDMWEDYEGWGISDSKIDKKEACNFTPSDSEVKKDV